MKNLLSLGAMSFLILMIATPLSATHDRAANETIQDRFVGAWRLAQLETEGPDGRIHRADSTGLLVFTRDGHISVQVMERNPPPQTTKQTSAPDQYSQGGYEASFGTYKLDESTHTFTYHVEGALVRTLVGRDLPRSFQLSGNQLIVKSTRPDEHWKATWEHYSIQESLDGKTVEWMEKVSDAQYGNPQPISGGAMATTREPSAAQKLFGDFDPKLAELTDNVLFGDVWERPGLAKRDRSLITVAALIALNRPDQLRHHLQRARDNGVTKAEVVEVITHMAFYSGWPSAVSAVAIAKEIFQ